MFIQERCDRTCFESLLFQQQVPEDLEDLRVLLQDGRGTLPFRLQNFPNIPVQGFQLTCRQI